VHAAPRSEMDAPTARAANSFFFIVDSFSRCV
jgi:hypothetical protein